ncbi:PLP-dependent transferase [Mucidula mucida]|nr:PLP-dependent transferase [Mucidula mucida]
MTWILDTLRRTDYSRLEKTGETYVDYMGGAIYPESLIRVHTEFLNSNVLGNTHSVSNSSKLSLKHADQARAAVLSFFHAPPGYTVVFTQNATGALKLVGESFPFVEGSAYVLSADSHNSVHGIRQFASEKGGHVAYIPCQPQGGVDVQISKDILNRNRAQTQENRKAAPCLFALTGQSNVTNSKSPLSLLFYASSLGYYTLLDAAALAPTSVVNLTETPVDAMAISFYKMFGFPTGVGALVVKKSFLKQLKRPWFAGGTVDVVQVPGTVVTRSSELHEQFEDGTINYLTLPAVTDGLRFLSAYLPFLPLRLATLLNYTISSLSLLRHDSTGAPVVNILSRIPLRRLTHVGDQSDTGSTISMIFLSPSGEMIPNSFIEYSASQCNVSLRTGCMCNPGGAAALLGIEDDMAKLYPGVTMKDFQRHVGRELGVVRVSLGLASDFQDVWRLLQFANRVACSSTRLEMWAHWVEAVIAAGGSH